MVLVICQLPLLTYPCNNNSIWVFYNGLTTTDAVRIQLLVQEYTEKLKVYCNVNDIQIRSNPKNTSNVNAQIEGEDGAVMQHIRSDDWVVMLDENGLDIGSIEMAELLGDAGNTGSSALTFCIGGPYGHGKQLRERANVTIKLSSMVLNHQIALVVLMEQLYRAWTILKGQKYHH
ncbi:23S rRNA (pseudouridine(1915)-N(3))-methyltransferase [Ranunculus cassubicifolius]